jgi:branched-chain amino acid transport system substrate-binding protein
MRVARHLRSGGLLLVFVLFTSAGVTELGAQTETSKVQPYASMDAGKVAYRGPGRGNNNDFRSAVVYLAVLLPMQGPRAAEGNQLLQAAQVAIDEENKTNPLPGGQRFGLAVGEESGPWGQVSSTMVRLLMENESVALITSTDGNIAHQAEQIANKVGVPVVTLSSDPTTTSINIPWIFRVGPSDAEQARAMAEHIYGANKLHQVLLITESGHDGRVGGEAFVKAAASMRQTLPERFEINSENAWQAGLRKLVTEQHPDAVVVWTSSALANQLLPIVQQSKPMASTYLCQRAAEFFPELVLAPVGDESSTFTVGLRAGQGDFAGRYMARTGMEPGIAAHQINDAVRVIAEAVRRAGANRARVRDHLAANTLAESVSEGIVLFDPAGNARGKASLVSILLKPEESAMTAPE